MSTNQGTRTRRLGVFATALLALAVHAVSVRGDDGAIEVPAPTAVQWLQVETDVELLGSFEKGKTSRRVACSIDVAGRWRLVPRHVEVRGPLTQRFGSSGRLYRAFLRGKEGPGKALSEPALAAFWSSVEVDDGILRIGWLDADGEIEIPAPMKEVNLQRSDDPTPERVAIADGIVLVALEALPGTWAEDATRTVHIQLARDEEEPEGVGRLRIGPLRAEDGEVVVPLHLKIVERERHLGIHTLEAEGSLTLGSDGLLRRGAIRVGTGFPDPKRPQRRGSDRTTLRIEGQAEPIEENQAREYAQLVARSREDPLGLARETLKETQGIAFALLSRIRPDVDLKGWTVMVWEDPPEKDGPWPPLKDTVVLLDHVELALAAHAETIGWFVPVREAIDRLAKSRRPDYRVAPKAKTVWVHPDEVDSPLQVCLAVVTAAHARAGHPGLRRFGVRGDATDWAFIDLDGLLATALTVEGLTGCHHIAIGSGVPSNSQAAAQKLRAMAGSILRPRPSADPRGQRASWGNRALGVMVGKIEADDDLGDLVRRAWKASTHHTRDLYPEAPPAESRPTGLWRRSRTGDLEGATGATQVGTSIFAWLLLQDGHEAEDAESMARALCDGVLVRTDTGALWVTRWATEDDAGAWETVQKESFERVEESDNRAGTVRRRGPYVIATCGEVPAAWVDALLDA